jgi:uncharacterized membrane protein
MRLPRRCGEEKDDYSGRVFVLLSKAGPVCRFYWTRAVPTIGRLDEHRIHLIFEATLFLKGAFAFFEIIGGILTYAIPQALIFTVVSTLTQRELVEDPRDFVANYLLHASQHLSIGTQHFAAIYLLSHGAIKLWLILGLLRERLWYYPTAIAVFGLFIVYQLYRFSFTHSAFLLFITALDVLVIILTWHEYGYLRRQLPQRHH